MKINPDLEIIHQFENFPTIPPIAKTDRVGGIISGGDIEVDSETGKVTVLGGGGGGGGSNVYKLDSQNLSSTDFSVKYSTQNSYVKEEFSKQSLFGSGAEDDDGKAKWRIIMNDIPGFTFSDVYKGLIQLTNTDLSLMIKTGGADFCGFHINFDRIFAMGKMELTGEMEVFGDVKVSNEISADKIKATREVTTKELTVLNETVLFGTSTFYGHALFRSRFDIIGGTAGQYLRKTETGTEWGTSPTGVSTDVENTWTADQKIQKGENLIFKTVMETGPSADQGDIKVRYHKNTVNYTGWDGLTIFNTRALRLYLYDNEESSFTWIETGGRFSYSTMGLGGRKQEFSLPVESPSDGDFLRYSRNKLRSEWVSVTPGSWNGGTVTNPTTFYASTNFSEKVNFNREVSFGSEVTRISKSSPTSLDVMNSSMTDIAIDGKIKTHNENTSAHPNKLSNPSGGTQGQFLRKTSAGAEWADVSAGSWSGGTVSGQATFDSDVRFNYIVTMLSVPFEDALNQQLINKEMAQSFVDDKFSTHNTSESSHASLFNSKITSPSAGLTGQYLRKTNAGTEWADVSGGGGVGPSDIEERIQEHNVKSDAHYENFQQKITNPLNGEVGQVLTLDAGLVPYWSDSGGVSEPQVDAKISTHNSSSDAHSNEFSKKLDSPPDGSIGQVLTITGNNPTNIEWKNVPIVEWNGGTVKNNAIFTNNVSIYNDLGEKNVFNVYSIEKNKTKDEVCLGKYISNGCRIEMVGGFVANDASAFRLAYANNPNALDNIMNDSWHPSWMNDQLAITNIEMLFKMWDTRDDYITKAFYKICPRYFDVINVPVNYDFVPGVAGYMFIKTYDGTGHADLDIAGRNVTTLSPGDWNGNLFPMRDVDTARCRYHSGGLYLLFIPCIYQR